MLMIIIDWLYILFTTFCLGYAFSQLVHRLFSYQMKHVDSILMTGLVGATVYAQVFSFFHGVSLLANALLLAFSICVVLLWHRPIRQIVQEAWIRNGKLAKLLIPVLFLAWAYFTSRGYMVPDTQQYHAQSIRWIEEYGIVKGQGILNTRYSYNSSLFSLSALYSLKFVMGQSLHAVNGWIAFLLSVTLLDLIKARKKFRWSDFANVAAIYYLTTISDEIIAPSSDYASMCIIFFLIIKWVRLLEQPKEEQVTAPYALLCVLGVYALSLKLTAGLILLLLIKPAYRLLRDKEWKAIGFYLLTGLAVALPWLVRGVWISGWLFYPFAALDLFDVEWKQRAAWVVQDAAQIKTWGRGVRNSLLVDQPIWEWFGIWFGSELSRTEQLLILADLASILCFMGLAVKNFFARNWEKLDQLLVLFTIVGCYLYWQFSAPLPRYGYSYMLLLAALTVGWMILALKKDLVIRIALAAYGVYKVYVLTDYICDFASYPAYIHQEDYESAQGEVYIEEVDGVRFYRSEWEPLGYEHFPENTAIEPFVLRGDSIEDGFQWAAP